MAIVSSVIARDDAQRDARRWIEELHTDQLGLKYPVFYLAPDAAWDAIAAMTGRVAVINANLTATEIASNVAQVVLLGSLASPVLNYSSATENFAALRVAYRTATDRQEIMIADFLNTLTNAQLATAFGITTTQAATLRTNALAPGAALATQLRARVGQ